MGAMTLQRKENIGRGSVEWGKGKSDRKWAKDLVCVEPRETLASAGGSYTLTLPQRWGERELIFACWLE